MKDVHLPTDVARLSEGLPFAILETDALRKILFSSRDITLVLDKIVTGGSY